MGNEILIIGIGNEFRQDDGVGLAAARILKALQLPNTRVLEQSGEGVALMDAWSASDRVILVDAVGTLTKPGTLYHLDPQVHKLPSAFFAYSSHAFGVAEAIELTRELKQLPLYLSVYGIEGEDFGAGIGLTPKVERALEEAVVHIAHEVEQLSQERSG